MRVLIAVLGLVLAAQGQTTVSGGSFSGSLGSAVGGGVSEDFFASCRNADITGRTLITTCGAYPGGLYYLNGPLNCDGTALAVNGGTVGFDLEGRGNKITYSNVAATQVFDNGGAGTTITVASTYNVLPRPGTAATDGESATIIDISNQIDCGGTPYYRDTHYTIGQDHPTGAYKTSAANRSIIWLTGGPAVGVSCTIPSYTVSFPRFGFLNANGTSAYVRNTGNTLNPKSSSRLNCVEIEAGANPTFGSMPIFQAQSGSGTFTNLILTSRGWQASAIGFSYSSNNTVSNAKMSIDPTSGIGNWRSYYDGYVLWDFNFNNTTPNTYTNITVTDGYNGGVVNSQTSQATPSVTSYVTCNTLHSRMTNGFCILTRASYAIAHHNTGILYDPNDLSKGGRGMLAEGSYFNYYNNYMIVHDAGQNLEYAEPYDQCVAGGAYGFQSEHNNVAGVSHDNTFIAMAHDCPANGARLSGPRTEGADPAALHFYNETYKGLRHADDSQNVAVGLMLRGLTGLIEDSVIVGSTNTVKDNTQDNVDPATNAILRRVTLKKDTVHPDPLYHTWSFANIQPTIGVNGFTDSTANVNCVDCSVADGASLTDVIGFKVGESGQYKPYELLISWTYTVHVTAGGSPLEGATVTMTDTLSNVFTPVGGTTTDVNGDAVFELPQYRIYNTAGAAVNQEARNPYSLSITKSGCSPVSASGISVTTTTTSNRTTTCP